MNQNNIMLMADDGKFHELNECSKGTACTLPLKKLTREPFNLSEGQLIRLRGNGKYNGRYYYDWKQNPRTGVDTPMLQARAFLGSVLLRWSRQQNAREYEIYWSVKHKNCGEFV